MQGELKDDFNGLVQVETKELTDIDSDLHFSQDHLRILNLFEAMLQQKPNHSVFH